MTGAFRWGDGKGEHVNLGASSVVVDEDDDDDSENSWTNWRSCDNCHGHRSLSPLRAPTRS